MNEFQPFPKVPRLSRNMVITEKIDGTNASVHIIKVPDDIFPADQWNQCPREGSEIMVDDQRYWITAASRKRWINIEADNFGFAKWVDENAHELVKLGEGSHFGEWWGLGIQRNYGLEEKRFSLFNVGRWLDTHTEVIEVDEDYPQQYAPECCHVVPILHEGPFDTNAIDYIMRNTRGESTAAPGFSNPEGIMIYHEAARQIFKKTYEGDEKPKSLQVAA